MNRNSINKSGYKTIIFQKLIWIIIYFDKNRQNSTEEWENSQKQATDPFKLRSK